MKHFILMISLLFGNICFAQVVETRVTVRAKAKDAKFIGSSMGGAQVNIRNENTGELLASGIIQGATGNTQTIMRMPHERGKSLADDETAKFEAVIKLNEPTFCTIEVIAPLGQRQSSIKASTQVWLIPGKHITGDGIVLEIPGFAVDIQEPGAHRFITLPKENKYDVSIKANVVLMCGCTVTKGGMWNADDYEVVALVYKSGKEVAALKMNIISDNLFETVFSATEKGVYTITVYAYDKQTGNTGVDKSSFIIQ